MWENMNILKREEVRAQVAEDRKSTSKWKAAVSPRRASQAGMEWERA